MKQTRDEKILRIQNAMISLTKTRNINNISIYDIASEAHMSSSTIYYYYPNVEALLSTMIDDILSGFFDVVDCVSKLENLTHWKDVNRNLEIKFARYCENNPLAFKSLYTQHQFASVKEKEIENDIKLGNAILKLYDDKFHLPKLPDNKNIFTIALQVSDKLYQSYHDDNGFMYEDIVDEAIILTESYLNYYLPQHLPLKQII